MTSEGLDARVVALKAHGETRVRNCLGNDPEANALLRSDSMAMLIGLVLQRGLPFERVWRIPLHLYRHLGHLDPSRLAQMSVEDMTRAFENLDVRHRFPAQAASTIVALAELVTKTFGGDGSRVWRGRAVLDVIAELDSLPWVGSGIANMTVLELMHEAGYEPDIEELPDLDVKADVHVVRVFYRLGISDAETVDAALRAARRHHRAFPGLLDWPAWDIGNRFCKPRTPSCSECPLVKVCERRGVG